MCKAPKPPPPTPPPDQLTTQRDGEAQGSSAAKRKRSGLRLDMNNSERYSGLTIPQDG